MGNKPIKVHELAAEAKYEVEAIVYLLRDGGLFVASPSSTIPSRRVHKARDILGLSNRNIEGTYLKVSELSARAGKSEEEIREILSRANILRKRRLKRIPRYLLVKAEESVGLRNPVETQLPLKEREAARHKVKEAKTSTVHRKSKPSWPTIGPPQDLIYLTAEDAQDIHWVLVEDFAKSKDPIEPAGVRDKSLLESAVYRPRTAIGHDDKYPSMAMSAAALLHSMVLDHPFHNGNKRTAIVTCLVFLDKNGWVLNSKEDEIYNFLLQLADHSLFDRDDKRIEGSDAEVIHSANWLQSRIRRVSLREHPMQFRDLRAILSGYECTMENTKGGGRINISRNSLHTQITYWDEGSEVDKNTTHKVRRDLQLDEDHGYDSDIFYNRGPRISEFINKYRKLLVRLAKV